MKAFVRLALRANAFLLTALSVLAILMSTASATQIDKTLTSGKVRIHYANTPTSCDAILLGVGTAMSASSYDKLSSELTSHGYVTVILDHNPGDMIKTDGAKFTALTNEVKQNLLNWIGNSNCNAIAHWVVGGHSAGGQAAQDSVSNNPQIADAIFSIDPYNANNAGSVNLPALYWGFDVTTCFVSKNDAAKAAYYKSQNLRAFYKVKKKYSWGPCGYSPKYFHCSFCDGHCPACTNCMQTPDHFFTDVGTSVNKFINAVFYGSWSKSQLSFNSTTPLTLYVDNEQP